VRVVAIKVKHKEQGEFVMESLRIAEAAMRLSLEDMALVTHEEGAIHIHQTHDATVGKGVRRGALVGALVGLAAPPLLAAAAVGAGAGALWGKFRDKGIDDDLMKKVGAMLGEGEAAVFALGDDASMTAIENRVREMHDGDVSVFNVELDDEAILRDSAVDVPEPTGLLVKMPYS
jgi:uncharacterized membrane protein